MVAVWRGQSSIWGPNESVRMALLTVCLTGVQLVWGVEMAYCSPYLLSLGLSKSMMSLVWIVGPLSGLITQPIVGVLADRSTSRWGRRRPVMVIGTILTVIALLTLGWTKEIVHIVLRGGGEQTATIVAAVLAMYLLDFAVNAVQACCRALIVDSLPTDQQQMGNAWASRMIAVGNVGGYLAGTIHLMGIFGKLLGDTQFKQLTVLCSFALCLCIMATCLAVSERVLVERADDEKDGLGHILRNIWDTMWHMPRGIAQVCQILFFAWIGWFPFMVYGTTFVGEVLKRYDTDYGKHKLRRLVVRTTGDDNLGDIARVGSLALVIFSCVSLGSSFVLPWIIESPESDEDHRKEPKWGWLHELLIKVEPYRPDLATAWLISHVLFAMAMFSTLFTRTVAFATFLVGFCGVPWSLMTWAPFSFTGEEINRLAESTSARLSRSSSAHRSTSRPGPQSYDPLLGSDPTSDHPDSPAPRQSFGSVEPSPDRDAELGSPPEGKPQAKSELAGIYLGILNVFACLPQFVATFISFVVFSILEPGKSPEFGDGGDGVHKPDPKGVNAIAVVLGIGGVSALCAAHYTWSFKVERDEE